MERNVGMDWLEVDTALGAGMAEYMLVVFPAGELKFQLEKECSEFKKKFLPGEKDLPASHIVVASFLAKEMMEDVIIKWIQGICSTRPPFTMVLKDYGGYPQESIFVRVQDSEQLVRMAQQLKIIDEYVQSNDCPALHIPVRPQLVIASGLTPAVYEKAMAIYATRNFHALFEIKEIALMKSRQANKGFSKANIFHLPPAR